jgi:serine/threonine-protein kinase
MACLDEATVLELVQGRLTGARLAGAEAHVASCGECRMLLSALARSSLVMRGEARRTLGQGTPPTSGHETTVPSEPPVRMRSPVEAPVAVGDVVAGKYAVERIVGAGGMGVVVVATHMQLGQNVALKFLLPSQCEAPGAVERFLREAKAAVQIQSEHVARVTDVGTTASNAPYMVMEFLRGTDLGEVLRSRGRLPIEDVVDYVLQACEAIGEAHSLGIVHRDLKPANLFLTARADGSALVKVLDFGISKATGDAPSSLTTGEVMMGSPRYMSPEQMKSSRDVDARTDLWALGIILYELVVGAPPFEAESMAGLCAAIATEPAPRARAARPDVPEALDAVIAHCLEKHRDQRVQSVADLARALSAVAPAQARISIERIVRLGAGSAQSVKGSIGFGATTPAQPVSSPPLTGATGGAFGSATGAKSRAASIGIGSLIAAILLVGATGVTLLVKGGPLRSTGVPARGEVAPQVAIPTVPPISTPIQTPTPTPSVTPTASALEAPPPPSVRPAGRPRPKPASTLQPPSAAASPPPPPAPSTNDVNRSGLFDRK